MPEPWDQQQALQPFCPNTHPARLLVGAQSQLSYGVVVQHWIRFLWKQVSWEKRAARSCAPGLHLLPQELSLRSRPCRNCAVGMPLPGCLPWGSYLALLTWPPALPSHLPYSYGLAHQSISVVWPWLISLDLLCSSFLGTVGLYSLHTRSQPLPTLLPPGAPRSTFLTEQPNSAALWWRLISSKVTALLNSFWEKGIPTTCLW